MSKFVARITPFVCLAALMLGVEALAAEASEPSMRSLGLRFIALLCGLVLFLRFAAGRLAPKAAFAPLLFLVTRWPVLVTWSVGAGGMLWLLVPGAIAKGHVSAADLGTLIGLSLFCGLGLAPLTVGPIFFLVRLFSPKPSLQLEPGETVARELPANHFLKGEARGGRLYLTDRRLLFRPHRFNVQLDAWSALLRDVSTVEASGDRFLVIRQHGRSGEDWLVLPNAAELAAALSAGSARRAANN